MAIKLGSISIDLQANTVSFSNAMDKASQVALNSSRNIQRSLTLISGAASAMAAGVLASLTAVIDKAEDTAFTMQRMAEATGTTSAMFSKLAYSAKLSGTPVELLSTAMERLSKTAGAARSGQKEQAAAFAASLHALKEILLGMSPDEIRKGVADYKAIGTYGQRVHQEANTRAMLQKYMNAPDLEQMTALPPAAKKEAPSLPSGLPKAEKVDQLKLKMAELASSAKAATQALADAGKGVDFERANEITKEYDKTIIELEAHLKTQHKTLTDADKAAIRSSIATRINDESQARFRNEVVLSTQQILAQASAQGILTAAIGQGAAAMRKAQVDAEFKTKYAGQSPEWIAANQGLINKQKAARNAELSAADGQKNSSALDSLKEQVTVQGRLNAAILAGRKAMEESRLKAEQAAIRRQYADRGDTNDTALNAELAKNEELFRLQRAETNLSRAASMDAARIYHDEADAIRDAAEAARAAGQPLSNMAVAQAQKAAMDSYRESVDKTTLSVGSLSDGFSVFFQQMSRDTESAAQQVHAVLGSAFESLNENLSRLLSGQKASFAEFFRGISSQLGKIAIQKGEQAAAGAILGKLGIGKTADPTVTALGTTNNYLRDILAVLSTRGTGDGSDSISTAVSSAAGGSGVSSIAGALTPFLSMVPGLGMFAGHRALGGDVMAGMSYDVGEMGRETFVPTQNGRIIPNNKLNGGNVIHMPIDARGSDNPAAVEMAVHRAMSHYGPAISAGTTRAINEAKARAPLSKR